MTGKCKRLHARKCKFCDRFWRAVISYAAVGAGVLILAGFVAGSVAAFYWAGML